MSFSYPLQLELVGLKANKLLRDSLMISRSSTYTKRVKMAV